MESNNPSLQQTQGGSHVEHDCQLVTATIQNVEIPLGEYIQSSTESNAVSLAQTADQAHTRLTNMKDTIAVDGNDHASTAVAGELYGAVNDLKNSMGAIGTFLASPNPATVASFTNQFTTAVSEWNTAVEDLYHGKSGHTSDCSNRPVKPDPAPCSADPTNQ